jgi:hypothetical protein
MIIAMDPLRLLAKLLMVTAFSAALIVISFAVASNLPIHGIYRLGVGIALYAFLGRGILALWPSLREIADDVFDAYYRGDRRG